MRKIEKYGLLIVRDGKFLINREFGTKLFLMPGGKPEKDESIEECLIREIKEEHDCELINESLEYFGEFEDIAANELNTLVNIKLFKGEVKGEPKKNSEIEEIRWFGRKDDKEILSPLIRNKILPEVIKRGVI